MEKETKRCPYCGEEILAVAKKCKHCGEWLTSKEMVPCPVCGEQIGTDVETCPYCKERIVNSAVEKSHANIVNDDILYCRHCKKPLSKDAGQCIYCGNCDPFYFSASKKDKKIGPSWLSIIGLVLILPLVYGILGFSREIILWGSIIVSCLLIALRILGDWYIKYQRGYYESEMRTVFDEVGDPRAIERWKSKLKQVLES